MIKTFTEGISFKINFTSFAAFITRNFINITIEGIGYSLNNFFCFFSNFQ